MSENDQQVVVHDSDGKESLVITVKDGELIATYHTPENSIVMGGFEIGANGVGADIFKKRFDHETKVC